MNEPTKLSDVITQLGMLQEMADELTEKELPQPYLDRLRDYLEYAMVSIDNAGTKENEQ